MTGTLERSIGATKASPPILLVEDDSGLADAVKRLLRRVGYAVELVESGAAAIQHLTEYRPALVILDLRLPDIHGLQVLRWLRVQSETPQLPVVVFTSSTETELLHQCYEAGATEVWIKGTVDFFEIIRRIAAYAPLSDN